MDAAFYLAGGLAVVSTVLMLTRLNVVHALLYLVLSLLAVAVAFFAIGAPMIGALEVIVYAGAIMVLFVFVVMMLNLGEEGRDAERRWLTPGIWVGPLVIGSLLLAEALFLVVGPRAGDGLRAVDPKDVSIALFGPYAVGVELASMLLLAGLVGAYHLGWRQRAGRPEEQEGVGDVVGADGTRPAAGGDPLRAGARRPPRAA